MVSLRAGPLTVGAAVVQCAETQSTALGRGSPPARLCHAAPVSPASSARVGAPWETKMLGSFGSGIGGLLCGLPLKWIARWPSATSAPSRRLPRDDQHAVDAPAIHVHQLRANSIDADDGAHPWHATDACHH